MSYIQHSDVLFVRGKYNSMDVVNVDDLSYIKTIDTSGCGVFSALQGIGQQKNYAYVGCYEGHLYAIELESLAPLRRSLGHIRLTQGIYGLTMLPNVPEPTLMCAQHFGYVDFVSVFDSETRINRLKLLEGGVQLTTNSIFYLDQTLSRKKPKESISQAFVAEYALATYLGLSFI